GVEIKNGTIQGFDAGIHLRAGANSALIRGLQPAGNSIGIEAADSDNGLFTRNSVHGNSTGVVIGGTFSNVPAGNRIERNQISENHRGIFLGRTADTAIRNNRLAANTSSAIEVDDAAN